MVAQSGGHRGLCLFVQYQHPPPTLGLEQSSSLPSSPTLLFFLLFLDSSSLLCLHCLRLSTRLTIPSGSDSTVVCLLLYMTLSFPYLPPRTRIFWTSRRLSVTARNTGRKNPITKAIGCKKRRKWEFSETARTVFRIHLCLLKVETSKM